MAYDKEKIYEQAIEAIKKRQLIYIQDVYEFVGISAETFYRFFPIDSNKYETIKREIQSIKVRHKINSRNKWYESDNPTLQLAYYKIIANQDERDALNNRIDQNNEVSITNVNEHFKNIADAIAKSDTDTDTTI